MDFSGLLEAAFSLRRAAPKVLPMPSWAAFWGGASFRQAALGDGVLPEVSFGALLGSLWGRSFSSGRLLLGMACFLRSFSMPSWRPLGGEAFLSADCFLRTVGGGEVSSNALLGCLLESSFFFSGPFLGAACFLRSFSMPSWRPLGGEASLSVGCSRQVVSGGLLGRGLLRRLSDSRPVPSPRKTRPPRGKAGRSDLTHYTMKKTLPSGSSRRRG